MSFNAPDIRQFKLTGSTVGDVHFPHVGFLLPFDGSNGATSTSDLSNNVRVITFYGTAQLSTAQSKFGGSSLLLDGDSDYLTCPYVSADTKTEFTAELWFKTSSSSYQTIFANYVSSLEGFYIQINNGTIDGGVDGSNAITSSITGKADGNWHHVALTRNSSNLITIWIDGVSGGTVTDSTSIPNSAFYIGRLNSSSIPRYFNGYIDDVRWTPGVCRYTSTFTPPTTAHLTSAGDANKQIIVNSSADGVDVGTGGINQARIAKAWCNFDGTGTPSIRGSYNCSSITDIGTGSYKVNFSTGMSDEGNYVAFCAGAEVNTGSSQNHLFHLKRETPTSDILNEDFVHVASANTSATQTDDGLFCVLVFGN